jgi:hypothetical protein
MPPPETVCCATERRPRLAAPPSARAKCEALAPGGLLSTALVQWTRILLLWKKWKKKCETLAVKRPLVSRSGTVDKDTTPVRVCMSICIYLCVCVCINGCMCMCMHVYNYMDMHVDMEVYMYTYICMCMHMCVREYVYVCVYTHTYTYTHNTHTHTTISEVTGAHSSSRSF